MDESMEPQDPTKVRLLAAAGEEFAEKGFDCARIRTICERAQANVAAVNYHFGDKEQLYVQAVLEAHRCGFESEGGDEGEEAGGAAEQLRSFIHYFLSRVLALHDPDDWRHRLMMREMLHPTPASDILIREAIRPRFERLARLLRQFCPGAEERKLQALAFSVIGQCLHYKMARSITERLVGAEAMEALDLDYLTEHITTFCLAALGQVPPLNAAGETAVDEASSRT
jgi:TetR/AcrR family transcriptional regulator, regulator of cefoperazone and chloramphenicol sensitivity